MSNLTFKLVNRLNKADLQKHYKEAFAQDAPEEMTVVRLRESLINKLGLTEVDEEGKKNGGDNTPPDSAKAPEQSVAGSDELRLERVVEGSDEVEFTTMKQDAYNLLPSHKYGWKISKPTEIK